MKAPLALTFTTEGITLLARADRGAGWVALGALGFDDPNLGMGLARLRDKAEAAAGPHFTTLLVLPNDQLLYKTIPLGGQEPRAAALAALDGATPYAVEDLSFDISPAQAPEPAIHIAAVALETLAEAEEFALNHGLRPVAFTAVPEARRFEGAPHLGQTGSSEDFLNGAEFEAESDPVRQIEPQAQDPAPEPSPDPAPTPEPTPLPAPPAEAPSAPPPEIPDAPLPELPPKEEAPPPLGFASRRQAPLNGAKKPGPTPEALAAAARLSAMAPRFGTARPTQKGTSNDAPPPAKKAAATSILNAFKKAKPSAPAPAPDTTDEAMALSLPGLPRQKSNSRLGLWLTLVLLAILVGIGLWSLFALPPDTLSRLLGRDQRPTIAATLPEMAPIADRAPLPETGATGAGPDEAALAAALLPATTPPQDQEDVIITPAPIKVSPKQAVEIYNQQRIWVLTPDAPVPVDPDQLAALTVPSLDQAPRTGDPSALPTARSMVQDVVIARPAIPPPAGTTFELNAQGLVIPTPEGAYAPSGARIFAGPPRVDVVPGARPEDQVITAEDRAAAALADLSRRRPVSRPANYAERAERALNRGYTLAELAALRPEERPQSAQDSAVQAARIAAGASLATDGVQEADSAKEPAEPAFSALALAQSAKPAARPANFATVVAKARARRAQEAPQATAAVASAAPRIPTSASVSKAATQRNVLIMNRTALLGVFGKPSSPKALVRLKTGRTSRVGVGDSLDGGQVIAIGPDRLVYRKGGRDVQLEMPRI